MTNPDDEAVGSAEVRTTAASSVPSATDQIANAPIAKVAATAPHNAFLKGLLFPHQAHEPSRKPWRPPHIPPHGVGSVFATTQVTKKWTAPQGSCAATVEDTATYTSYALTSVTTPKSNSCTTEGRRAIPNSTEMEKVEVEPTSILKGG